MDLEIRSLTAGYGNLPIVFDVSAQFGAGKISAIIGPNGSGKSTLVKSLFGQARIFEGTVSLDGRQLRSISPSHFVAQGVVYVPQLANVFPSLSVRDNLEIGGYVRPGTSLDQVLALFPDLEVVLNKQAGKLSGGQRNMLAVGRALVSNPQVLLLDEATSGLSPRLSTNLWEHLVKLARDGLAVGIVEQNVDSALEHSDYIYLLASGRVVTYGPTRDVGTRGDLDRLFLNPPSMDVMAKESAST